LKGFIIFRSLYSFVLLSSLNNKQDATRMTVVPTKI